MGDFFKVGETYENRLGEYEVVEIKTPTLQIRYTATGRLQDVEEELQERIVRNLRREVELANQPPAERKTGTRAPRTKAKKAKFGGFAQADFQGLTGGSSWRAKTGLAGVLAQTLVDRTGESFDSWAPSRKSTCYVTSPEEASQESLGDSAQFYVKADHDGLNYGLEIHRPADSAEGATAWDRFLTSLSEDDPTATVLNEVLLAGKVELSWYAQAWGPESKETVRGEDASLLLDRGSVTETDTIEAVIERLNQAPADQVLTLNIEASLAAEDAIAAGEGIAETIGELFIPLYEIYRACKG